MPVQYSMGIVTITESFKTLDCIDQVSFSVTEDDITVTVYDRVVTVSWDQLDDVDSLSEAFGDWPVRLFKVVVPVLGKIYKNKQTFLEL